MASSIKFCPKLLAVAFCAASFSFLSCSGDDDGGSGGANGTETTETFVIQNITESSFDVTETYYNCYSNDSWDGQGELEEYNPTGSVNYTIDNRTLELYGGPFYEPLSFNGASSSLIGTWTRTPGMCEPDYDNSIYCDSDDITKAVITNNSLQVTGIICPSRWFKEETEYFAERGMSVSVSDCNNYSVSKGSDKITISATVTGHSSGTIRATYNNKPTCSATFKESTVAEMRAACRTAYNKAAAEGGNRSDMEDYYYDIIEGGITQLYTCLVTAGAPEELISAIF